MDKITISKADMQNLIGYILDMLDFVDTESMDEENVDKVANGYVDFVEPMLKMLEDMKDSFLDIKEGDIVIAFDDYKHDYDEHILRIDSIEYDECWITETNPKGMVCYGTDLEEDEWGDDYITEVHEGNFVRFKKEEKPE